ncbi:hypothetical protein GCM10023340_39380 [Nocardioides marinquilinus]|jgi:hypothetical protein|uniref:DUF4244 domain-containing protein n=1 Tax=Nocardioides marinquilinus TaxID=1210400 RepID=A0ABP9PZS7_9ACTN
MTRIHLLLARLYLSALALLHAPRRRDDRGDVPGWVMITLMSSILVGALLVIARPQMSQMLRTALNSIG